MATYRINCYRCNNQFFSEFYLTSLCSICHNADQQEKVTNSYRAPGPRPGLDFLDYFFVGSVLTFIMWVLGVTAEIPLIQMIAGWGLKLIFLPVALFFATIFGLVTLDVGMFIQVMTAYLTF